jgi:hypothetical protein
VLKRSRTKKEFPSPAHPHRGYVLIRFSLVTNYEVPLGLLQSTDYGGLVLVWEVASGTDSEAVFSPLEEEEEEKVVVVVGHTREAGALAATSTRTFRGVEMTPCGNSFELWKC